MTPKQQANFWQTLSELFAEFTTEELTLEDKLYLDLLGNALRVASESNHDLSDDNSDASSDSLVSTSTKSDVSQSLTALALSVNALFTEIPAEHAKIALIQRAKLLQAIDCYRQ